MRLPCLFIILGSTIAICGARGALVAEGNFEDSANPWNDSSGNGYNGTSTSSKIQRTTTTAARGLASMESISVIASSYLSLPTMTSQFGASEATLTMWVKLGNATPGNATQTGLTTFGNSATASIGNGGLGCTNELGDLSCITAEAAYILPMERRAFRPLSDLRDIKSVLRR